MPDFLSFSFFIFILFSFCDCGVTDLQAQSSEDISRLEKALLSDRNTMYPYFSKLISRYSHKFKEKDDKIESLSKTVGLQAKTIGLQAKTIGLQAKTIGLQAKKIEETDCDVLVRDFVACVLETYVSLSSLKDKEIQKSPYYKELYHFLNDQENVVGRIFQKYGYYHDRENHKIILWSDQITNTLTPRTHVTELERFLFLLDYVQRNVAFDLEVLWLIKDILVTLYEPVNKTIMHFAADLFDIKDKSNIRFHCWNNAKTHIAASARKLRVCLKEFKRLFGETVTKSTRRLNYENLHTEFFTSVPSFQSYVTKYTFNFDTSEDYSTAPQHPQKHKPPKPAKPAKPAIPAKPAKPQKRDT